MRSLIPAASRLASRLGSHLSMRPLLRAARKASGKAAPAKPARASLSALTTLRLPRVRLAHLPQLAIAFALGAALITTPPEARAQSDASQTLSIGSLWVSALGASVAVDAVGQSGKLIVTGLKNAGASTTVFLRDASNATSQAGAASIEVASSVLTAAGVSVGTAVSAVAEPTGHALMAGGKMIAFVPNEIGRSLVGANLTRER